MPLIFQPFRLHPKYCGMRVTAASVASIRTQEAQACKAIAPFFNHIQDVAMCILTFCNSLDQMVVDQLKTELQTTAVQHNELHVMVEHEYDPYGDHFCLAQWLRYSKIPQTKPPESFVAASVFDKLQTNYNQLESQHFKMVKTYTCARNQKMLLVFTDGTAYYILEWCPDVKDVNFHNSLWIEYNHWMD